MKVDFNGIIKLIYDKNFNHSNDPHRKGDLESNTSAFKFMEGKEVENMKDTLMQSIPENRYYIILLVKAGMLIDCLDKMMSRVKKETFGSQCLKEPMEYTKRRAAETQHPGLCIYIAYQLGRISYLMRDFRQAKVDFKIAYEISEIFYDRYSLMKSAEWLGRTLSMLKMHHEAISYFGIMLHLAWIENNKKYENKAYDSLGLQHFYLGEIATAKKYHCKMVEGTFEPQNSEMIV